jgi:hypothetical protein
MFLHASGQAKNSLCCFVNADIILPERFASLATRLSDAAKSRFLAVGQRLDVAVSGEVAYGPGWEAAFRAGRELAVHPPTGSDFFLFPKGQYCMNGLPRLIVGRPGWDLVAIYHARKSRYQVIDMSPACLVYHQRHDYSHKKQVYANLMDEPEAAHNVSFLPERNAFDFTLIACDYVFSRDYKLKRNHCRGDKKAYLEIRQALGGSGWMAEIDFRLHAVKERIRNRPLSWPAHGSG